jgi:hypothetical protein
MRYVIAVAALVGILAVGAPSASQPSSPSIDEDSNSAAYKEGYQMAERMNRTRPPFPGARERWTCTFTAYNNKPAIMYLGVYGSYVVDEFEQHLPIVLDTSNALITSDSDYGEKAYDGTEIDRIERTLVIDRRDHSFKLITVEAVMGNSSSTDGICSQD